MRYFKIFSLIFFFFLMSAAISRASNSNPKIALNVKTFELKNGMQFLVVERPSMPQVACRLAIRAGAALEEEGKSGIAHMLEHMMFKGTKNFGTLDFKRDMELQDKIEAAYQAIRAEERKRNPDPELIKAKRAEMAAMRLDVQNIYVPQAFSMQLGGNGAVGVNAFTSLDQTQYIASVPSDMLEQWFSIISEQIFEPSWREFYVEKEVVQREWAYRYVNNPGGAAWLDLNSTAYRAHPYRNPTIGWKPDMEKFNTLDAISFHRKYYNPTNTVVVLVGDITVEKAKKFAETYFERYPKGERAPEDVTKEPPQRGPRRSIRYLKGARTPMVRIAFHTAKMGTRDFYALDALTMVLSQGRGSRMNQNIINKGLAMGAWSSQPDNRYGSMFVLGGSPKEPDVLRKGEIKAKERQEAYLKACRDLEEILITEIEKLKTDLVSDRELERIKKLNQRGFLDRMRSNEHLAGALARMEVQTGWRYLTTYLDRLAEVTPENIRDAAKKYITEDNKTAVFVIPGGRPEKPSEQYSEVRSVSGSAAKVITPASFANHSRYPTPDGWKHPLSFNRRPDKIKYPKAETVKINETTMFYLPDNELPLIDLTIFIKAGAVDFADDKAGLSGILNGTLIRGGTENYTPSELAMVLDENAIRLSITVHAEDSEIRLSVMKDDWEKGMEILEEVLTRARFDKDVLDSVKERALTAIKRQGGNAQRVSTRERKIWHFKGHPYGRDPLKALNTIPNITRDDLKSFLKTYFVPSNMVAAVAGDIEKDRAAQGLKKLFKSLPAKISPIRDLGDPQKTSPVLAMIHKPGQIQSQVALGLAGPRRTNPFYWKMNLLMSLFGGSDSLMYTRLRDDLGLVYSAWFYQTFKWKAGMLYGQIGCKGDKTADAIRETVKIMEELRKKIPEAKLEQKRLDILNSFVFNVDSPQALVETYARYSLRNEPLDTLGRIQDAFMDANAEELRALAEKFLVPLNLQIFVVGDKTAKIKSKDGSTITLEDSLVELANELHLPYKELALR